MTITLDDITLPADLHWQDETGWTPVVQVVAHGITGALLVDPSTKLAGRPITLGGDQDASWLSRTTVLALMAKAAIPGQVMTLTYHTRVFEVIFRHHDAPALEAEPIIPMTPPAAADWYYITLKLMAV